MKTKRILISVSLVILIFFSFINPVQASIFSDDDKQTDIENVIDKDKGGLFEKIIAKMIGGLAETVFDLTTNQAFGIGFKNYDELIFGNNQSAISPFTDGDWNLINSWYWKIAGIIGMPMFIAIVVLSWKMIVAGISPDKRNEVKDNLMRLFFGAMAIVLAPLFVKFMLMLNNNLVTILVANSHRSLDDLLGNSLLTSINTGNAIATAIVIALFAYLFVKINIKFIIRQFTLIVFTVFTPIVAVFWILNKRTIASSIWFGQIVINSFMQFVYAFLFLIYLTFIPSNAGWATSLLWGMMILPLGDALQNTMQNLVSRIAGVNNEELANRGIGMSAAMGHTIKSITYQFKGNNEESINNAGSESKLSTPDIISRVVSKANRSPESTPDNSVNYESYSQNAMETSKSKSITNAENKTVNSNMANNMSNNVINNDVSSNNISGMSNITMSNEQNVPDNINQTSVIKEEMKKAFNVGKEFMNLGMYMAEGRNLRTNNTNRQDDRQAIQRRFYNRANINNTRQEDQKEQTKKIITVEEDDIDE